MATNAQGQPLATDFTGSMKAKLEKEREAELARRRDEITLAAQAAADEAETQILDVTKTPEIPVVVDEVQVVTNDDEDAVVIRTNEDLDQVTIGQTTYNFVAGRKYKVPRNVAFHLDEKGRLWH